MAAHMFLTAPLPSKPCYLQSMSVPTRQGSTSDVDSILTSEPSSISCITPHESSSGGGSIRRPSFEAEIKHAMVRASRRPSFEVADPGEEALLAAAAGEL